MTDRPAPTEPQFAHGVRVPVPDTPITLRYQYVDELSAPDFEELAALFTRAFNGGPSWFRLGVAPEDHLRWKASDGRGASTRIELTENETGIVGFRMTMWRRFLVRGRSMTVTEGVDATIDPSLQGHRITSKRADFSRDRGMRGPTCFGLSYSMHPTSRIRRGVPGEEIISGESIYAFVRPLSLRGVIGRLRRGAPSSTGTSRTRSVMESQTRHWTSLLSWERLTLATRILWSLVKPQGRATQGSTLR